jgi:hypothetical protein
MISLDKEIEICLHMSLIIKYICQSLHVDLSRSTPRLKDKIVLNFNTRCQYSRELHYRKLCPYFLPKKGKNNNKVIKNWKGKN